MGTQHRKKLRLYGMKGLLIHFIGNITIRKIPVRVNDVRLEMHNLKEGLPQGSMLSCACFLLAINDLGRDLPQRVGRSLYVDDFVIIFLQDKESDNSTATDSALKRINE